MLYTGMDANEIFDRIEEHMKSIKDQGFFDYRVISKRVEKDTLYLNYEYTLNKMGVENVGKSKKSESIEN